MPAIAIASTVAGLAGTVLQANAGADQAAYESAVARNKAIQDQQKANEDTAIGQRAAITESRKAALLQSTLQARAAASGTDPLSPSTVDLSQDIGQYGGYNAMSVLYQGLSRSQADQAQADVELFNARRIRSAVPLTTAGTLIGGFGRTAGQVSTSPSLLKLFGG